MQQGAEVVVDQRSEHRRTALCWDVAEHDLQLWLLLLQTGEQRNNWQWGKGNRARADTLATVRQPECCKHLRRVQIHSIPWLAYSLVLSGQVQGGGPPAAVLDANGGDGSRLQQQANHVGGVGRHHPATG
jgi:hypothetical protein